MKFSKSSILYFAFASSSSAFMGHSPLAARTSSTALQNILDPGLDASIRRELNYKPGAADTPFARRYKHLVGAKVKTVGEAFAEFTNLLGYTVNPLYKNMVTDIVGTTHLIVVNARFQRDAIWSLGILTALELLLKNYPEPEVAKKIVSSLFQSVGLNEAEIKAEAKTIENWAQGKSREEVETALSGEGNSPLAAIVKTVQADDYWMYSRYFGVGLLRIMEIIELEMDKDEIYPVMESWMGQKIGKSHLTACADSDIFFKIKSKLDMMETMMKEIEIREKKRMAERLERKADDALRAAEREAKLQLEIEADNSKAREKVES